MNGLRLTLLVAAVCLFGVAGVAVTGAGDGDSPTFDSQATGVLADTHVDECAATPPGDHADPEGGTDEVIGWVDGYWYNESLDIEGQAIEEDELDSFVARTAARVEALRCLAFDEVPPTELLTREEYGASLDPHFDNISHEEWQFEDARLATMLVAGQEVDAKELQREVQTAFPAAFYDTQDEVMGFITDDPDTLEIDQVTLAHELTHALQDQHFGLGDVFDRPTNDQFIAALSVAEGDATTVDAMYEDNCEQEVWADECLIQPQDPDVDIPSFALALNQLAAYETPLVAERAQESWDEVDVLFETYPDSMVEAIYPNRYGEFERADITVEDRSSDEWERILLENEDGEAEEAFDIIGQHGLTSILATPSFETGSAVNVIDVFEFQQPHAGGDFNYSVSETSGWQADELYGYTNDAGDNASVWKLAWEDSDEAERFADAYADLISYRDGSLLDGYENVYTFENADEYDMALALEHDGDRVWVVTAPTTDDLTAVHEDIELLEADDDPSGENGEDNDNGVDDGVEDDEIEDDTVEDDEVEDEDGAALGLLHAAVGLVAVVALALILSLVSMRRQG